MRIVCKCGQKAKIKASNILSPQVKQLYCACSDVFCGHTFVMDLSFSHSINPPKQVNDGAVFELLQSMGEKDRQQLFNRFLSSHTN